MRIKGVDEDAATQSLNAALMESANVLGTDQVDVARLLYRYAAVEQQVGPLWEVRGLSGLVTRPQRDRAFACAVATMLVDHNLLLDNSPSLRPVALATALNLRQQLSPKSLSAIDSMIPVPQDMEAPEETSE